MNKTKKIAIAAVSLIMAGTMCLPLAACTPKTPANTVLKPSVDENGKLKYSSSTTLSMNVCDSGNNDRHITYHQSQIATSATLPDGKTYKPGDLKPAWAQMQADLGLKFVDSAANRGSDAQITDMIKNNEQAQYNIVTGSGNAITTNSSHFLNLNQYLEYMPNYKAFLDANPIVKWSLTSNTTTGAMYYAPYFDGNNDIEKYVLTHKEWTRVILDSADVSGATMTWADSKTGKADIGSAQTYVVGEMGTTGTYEVDTTDPADETKLVKLVVNYGAALTAAKDENSPLGAAYKTAAGVVYDGDSGNIVDIMNKAISVKAGAVTGAQLIGILRAYIDVAYQTSSGAKFYTTRSDVFNSVSAGWDVDLYTAISRCVVTSYKLFGAAMSLLPANQVYAVAGRQGTTQRRVDLLSFVGELYGVRGLESRNEFAYVDATGKLKDARTESASYDALNKFSALSKEGLVYMGEATVDKYAGKTNSIVTYSMHDYSQTQTTDGFYLDVEGFKGSTSVPNGLETSGELKFDFAPIVTPVAKWDTNSDGTKETFMRFTESWRAVKNTGFCVPLASVQGNPEKLAAVLAFIDYLFSNDGQLVATFGTMSTVGNTNDADGFWYGNKVGDVLNADGTVKTEYKDIVKTYDGKQYVVTDSYKSQYFTFKNVLYTGFDYLGTQVPVLTTKNLNYYYGLKVDGNYMGEGDSSAKGEGYITNLSGNYTNYCRGIIGGALPIGNKNQGFEYQATAQCGLAGADIVSKAIVNGAIKHLTQVVDSATYWYTCVPTTLPVNSTDAATLNSHADLKGSDSTSGLFLNTSKTAYRTNLFIDIMFYGYGASKPIASDTKFGTSLPANAEACLTLVNSKGMDVRAEIYADGWQQLLDYYQD